MNFGYESAAKSQQAALPAEFVVIADLPWLRMDDWACQQVLYRLFNRPDHVLALVLRIVLFTPYKVHFPGSNNDQH